MTAFLKCHPSPKGVKEDFDVYFKGNESGLFIQKKSNCTYATTVLNFIAKFSATLGLKTGKICTDFRFVFLVVWWCWFFFLVLPCKKEKTKAAFSSLRNGFLHSSWDYSAAQSKTPWQSVYPVLSKV